MNLCPNPLTTSHFAVLYASISDNVVSFTANGTSRNLAMKMDSLNLKPSTKYTMIVEITKNTVVSSDKAFRFASNGIGRGDAYLTVIGGQTSIEVGEVGTRIIPMITREDGNYTTSLMGFVPAGATSGEISFKICLLEGDHTQNPPSYFEGLKSVGQSATTSEDGADEIVVSSVNGCYSDNEFVLGMLSSATGSLSESGKDWCSSKNFINVEPNVKYNYNITVLGNNPTQYNVFYYQDGKYISNLTIDKSGEFTTPLNANQIKIRYQKYNDITTVFDTIVEIVKFPITEYQADKKRLLYYNNETQTWEKPILREWDSIEKHADGKYYYHKRSGEVIIDGLTNCCSKYSLDNSFSFKISDKKRNMLFLNNRFKLVEWVDFYNNQPDMSITSYDDGNDIVYMIDKSSSTPDDFNLSLQSNPITVVYQLAEEKVYECTNIDLITYASETNYVVSSGAIVPRTTLKVMSNISNTVRELQRKVSILENDCIQIFKYMLAGDNVSAAYMLYPEDFRDTTYTDVTER